MAANDIVLIQQVSSGSVERTFNPAVSAGSIPEFIATGLGSSNLKQTGDNLVYTGSLSATTTRATSSVYDGIGDIRTIPQNSQSSDYTLVASDAGKHILYSPTATPILSAYSLYSWGYNFFGQLGQGNTIDRSSPVQIGTLTNWLNIACGNGHNVVTKTDGTLWSWGHNAYGQLSLNNTANQSSPVQIGALTNWLSIACGYFFTVAIKTDNSLWSWGRNNKGQLGLNNTVYRSSPVQVGALTNWSKIVCSQESVIALKTDGTLWSWGGNGYGELGLNNNNYRSSPTQIGALSTWQNITAGRDHVAAIQTNGTLWAWGRNSEGQLGTGGGTVSSPVQVGALTNWNVIAAGRFHSVAVKTDGTLWSWGFNTAGQLGLNDIISRSSPVQVGALTNWSKIPSGFCTHTTAIKTDGTLWAWGYNFYGNLGLGDKVYRSSPTQVGALNTWSSVANGQNHTLATTLSTSITTNVFSIPSNTTTPWPIGTTLTFVNANSAYGVSLSAADTMRLISTGSTGTRTLTGYGIATALKTGQTQWFINGTGLT